MKSIFEDKEIVNPMDPDEVFTCSDLTEDYKICRKEKRMQTSVIGKRMNCTDYRALGKNKFLKQGINQTFDASILKY